MARCAFAAAVGIWLSIVGGAPGFVSEVRAAVEIEALVRTGDLVPGRPGFGDLTIQSIEASGVAVDGTIVFMARVADSNGFSSTGIWKRLPGGGIVRVVSQGDDALDFGFSNVIDSVDDSLVSLAPGGRVAFWASLGGAPPTPFALFVSALGTPAGTVVAGEQLSANGSGAGAEFAFFNSFRSNGSGGVVFSGVTRIPPSPIERGNVWISPGGINLEIALFPPPSGFESRFEWSSNVQVSSVTPDGSVDILGDGALQNPALPQVVPETAWIVANGFNEPTVEIFGAEDVPGILNHRVFEVLDVATNSSRTSVLAVAAEATDTLARTNALYVGQSGNGVPVSSLFSASRAGFFSTSGPPRLRAGEPAPGTGGLNFETFEDVAISDGGQIAFAARIFDPSQQGSSQEPLGLWIESAGGLEMVLLQNRPIEIDGVPTAPISSFRLESAGFDGEGRLVVPALLSEVGDSSLLLRVRAFLPGRPIVNINGRVRRKVRRPTVVIRGSVAADLPVVRTEFRSGVQRGFRATRGLEVWQARARLRVGRNVVRFRATDREGNASAVRRVGVRRLERR